MSFQLLVEKSVEKQRKDSNQLLDYVNQNRKDGYFNDVTLETENESIPANRLVLSCYSKFFETMFRTEMQEKYQRNAEIPSISANILMIIIEFMYTGKMIIDNKNVLDLLSAADYLLMDEVKQYCLEFLVSIVSPVNCLDLLKVATMYNSDLLRKTAMELIADQFDVIFPTEAFKNLSKLDLISLICKQSGNQVKATSIYKAIVSWTKHDEKIRSSDFVELFKLVKLNELPTEVLLEDVSSEVLVEENHLCLSAVNKEITHQFKNEIVKETGSKIVCLHNENGCLKTKEIFSLIKESPTTFPDLMVNIKFHQSVCFNNVIYCIGVSTGQFYSKETKQVWHLDVLQNKLSWKIIESMNNSRAQMGATLYKNSLVVAGGCDHSGNSLSSTELYSMAYDEWKLVSSLIQERNGNELVSSDDCLFCIGGEDKKRNVLPSVEKLKSLKLKWEYVAPMLTPRTKFAAVAYNGFIYAVGGQSSDYNSSTLKSAEKYDPQKDEWSCVSDMKRCRSGHAACVLQKKVYVVGGSDENGSYIREIDCFDPKTNEWETVAETDTDLIHHKVIVI